MKKITLIFTLCFFNFSVFAHTIHYFKGAPLEIIKIGHPTLTMVADEVPFEEIKTEEFQTFLDDMIETMKKAGGVGLAAPQVNVSKRVFIIKPGFFKKAEPIINPTVQYLEEHGQKMSSEGCLSIPGKTFKVKRYKKIHLSYYDRDGEYVTEKATGFRAIVAQHEYDHLNGILIADFFTKVYTDSDFEYDESAPRM